MWNKISQWLTGAGANGLPSLTYIDLLKNKQVTYRIEKDRIEIGRTSANDLVLLDPDNRVSRHHAVLCYLNEEWVVEDLNSAYGVYVNGEKVQGSATVHSGNVIRFAKMEVIFYDPLEKLRHAIPAQEVSSPSNDHPTQRFTLAKETLDHLDVNPLEEAPIARSTLVKEEVASNSVRTALVKEELAPSESFRATLVKEETVPSGRMTLVKPDASQDEALRQTVLGQPTSVSPEG